MEQQQTENLFPWLFLAGCDPIPTMRDVKKKFSVRCSLNLLLVYERLRVLQVAGDHPAEKAPEKLRNQRINSHQQFEFPGSQASVGLPEMRAKLDKAARTRALAKRWTQQVKVGRSMSNSMSAGLPYHKVLCVFYSMTKESLCVEGGGREGGPFQVWFVFNLLSKYLLLRKELWQSPLTHTVQVPWSPLGHTKKHETALLFLKELGSECFIHTISVYMFTHGEIRSWF